MPERVEDEVRICGSLDVDGKLLVGFLKFESAAGDLYDAQEAFLRHSSTALRVDNSSFIE